MTRSLFMLLAGFLCYTSSTQSQELTTEQIEFEGLSRTYLQYIPAGFDASSSLPLVMNFHGGTDNANSQLSIADMRSLADQDQFILVYPNAYPEPENGETNWQVVVSGDLPLTIPSPHDDIGFIDSLIDQVHAEFNIDLNRVYALGYSNGGGFTFDLACRLNERIAAVGVVARTMYIESYEACNVAHPTAVMTILGTADYISDYNGITYEGTLYYASAEDSHQLWIDANGIEGEPVQTAVANTSANDGSTADLIAWNSPDGCIALEHYRINNGGHDWPGTFGNMDIVAHEVIWNFVKNYGLMGHLDCASNSISDQWNQVKVDWSVFPNPANNQLNIATPDAASWSFNLSNAQGQVMQCIQSSGSTHTISCDNLPPGMYWMRGNDANGKHFSTRVVIER